MAPNINNQIECIACEAIKLNIIPSEDGLFKYESENDAFMSAYFKTWDRLKDEGTLLEYDTPVYGVMIDNSRVLELTRA